MATMTEATPRVPALVTLVAATDAALRDPHLHDDRARAEAIRPAMTRLLAVPDAVPAWACEPWEGGAVGNLLYADPAGRFHVLAVVFPEGTSSGVHHHGCWGVIGYLQGGDEETRYDDSRRETSRVVWHQGDVTYLLPDQGEGWHRVRNPGPGVGVSVHVLCRTPAEHPHRFWDRSTDRILDFPFVEVAPGRWRAEIDDRTT